MNVFAGLAEKRWNELLEGAVSSVPSADFVRFFLAGQEARGSMLAALVGESQAEVIQFSERAFERWFSSVQAALTAGGPLPVVVPEAAGDVPAVVPTSAPIPVATVPVVGDGSLEEQFEKRVGEVVDVPWLSGKPWLQRMYVDLGRVMLQQYRDVTEALNWLANHLRVMERAGVLHGDIGGRG